MPEWLELTFRIISLAFMLIGLFGMIVPIFPGLVVIWLVALVYGIVTGFNTLAWIMFAIMTVLMIIGNIADNFMMGKKARETGAAWSSIIAGLVAGFVISLLMTPLVGLIAAPLALFGAEYSRVRDRDKALTATKAMMIGLGWAFVIRFGLGSIMIVLWAVWAWF